MSARDEKWYDSDDPERFARGAGWFGLKWGTIFVVAILLISAVGGAIAWSAGVFTSDVKGRGDAIKQKNSAINRTQAQAQFRSSFESIRSLDQRLTDAQKDLDSFNAAHPNVGNGTAFDPLAEQQGNLMRTKTGLQQQCRNVVGKYNADTQTYTVQDFRDTDLPFKIESSDPAFTSGSAKYTDFDCQPTTTK